jgi:hypothetical protein
MPIVKYFQNMFEDLGSFSGLLKFLNLLAISLNFVYMAGITSDLVKKSRDSPRGVSRGSPDDFCRDNTAGPHILRGGPTTICLKHIFKWWATLPIYYIFWLTVLSLYSIGKMGGGTTNINFSGSHGISFAISTFVMLEEIASALSLSNLQHSSRD